MEYLERHGLYLIEDGQTIFLWVGRDAVPQLTLDVFGLLSYADLKGGKVCRFRPQCTVDRPANHTSREGYYTVARESLLSACQCNNCKDT